MTAIAQLGYWIFFINLSFTIVNWSAAWTLLQKRSGIYAGTRRTPAAIVGGIANFVLGAVTAAIFFLPPDWTRTIYTYVTPSLILVGTAGLWVTLRSERQLGKIAGEAIRRGLE